jgi:hypothetical protein
MGSRTEPVKTSVHDHESNPLAGSGMHQEHKSFAPRARAGQGSPQGADTEIAADDAGATAMAERAQKRSEGLENDG